MSQSKNDAKCPEEPWTSCGWTKSRYFGFIRSALRRTTMRYPAKQKYLEDRCRPAPPGSRFRKVADCEMCGTTVGKSKAAVDHITPAGGLKDYDDLPRFTETLFCGFDNFQILCSTCHDVKTLADKRGISFKEAAVEKEIIAFSKQPVNFQKAKLSKLHIDESEQTNQTKRANAYRDYLNVCKKDN